MMETKRRVAGLLRRSVDSRRQDEGSKEKSTQDIPQQQQQQQTGNERRKSWRISFRRTASSIPKNDSLGFTAVSMQWLRGFLKRLENGKEAQGVNLVVIQESSGRMEAGTTGWVVGEEKGKSTVSIPGVEKNLKVRTSLLRQKGRRAWTLGDVTDYVVEPLCKTLQTSNFCSTLPKESIQQLTWNSEAVYVSADESTVLRDLVRALEEYFDAGERKEEENFVWLKFLNLNYIEERDSGQLKRVAQGLADAIPRFEKRLVYFDSWRNPQTLESCWGIYDLYLCAKNDLDYKILTTKKVESTFIDEVVWSDSMMEQLRDSKTRNTNSEQVRGRTMGEVHFVKQEIMVRFPGGHQEMNLFVQAGVREWMSQVAVAALNRKREENRANLDDEQQLEFAGFLKNCAILLEEQGKGEESLTTFEEALYLYQVCLDSNDPRIADVLNHIGNTLQRQGRFEESLKRYADSLEICKRAFGEEDLSVADVMTNLARLHLALGNADEALELSSGALEIFIANLGPKSESAAQALSNLADCYAAKGDFESALETHQKALQIFKNTRGTRDQAVADSLRSMAEIYFKQGSRIDVALALYDESLLISIENLGESHPKVASCLLELSAVLADQGRLDGAIDLAEKALAVLIRFFGQSHQHVSTATEQLEALRRSKSTTSASSS